MKTISGAPPTDWPISIDPRRQLILAAMVRTVGRKGYRESSVDEVVAEANLPREAFDELFSGKDECFLAAYEAVVEEVVSIAKATCSGELPWARRIRDALGAILQRFAEDPAMARVAVVEVMAGGGGARQSHWAALNALAALLDEGRELGGADELPPNLSLMSVGAVSGLLFEEVAGGRTGSLPAMLPELLFTLLVPFLGPGAANAEVRALG